MFTRSLGRASLGDMSSAATTYDPSATMTPDMVRQLYARYGIAPIDATVQGWAGQTVSGLLAALDDAYPATDSVVRDHYASYGITPNDATVAAWVGQRVSGLDAALQQAYGTPAATVSIPTGQVISVGRVAVTPVPGGVPAGAVRLNVPNDPSTSPAGVLKDDGVTVGVSTTTLLVLGGLGALLWKNRHKARR